MSEHPVTCGFCGHDIDASSLIDHLRLKHPGEVAAMERAADGESIEEQFANAPIIDEEGDQSGGGT